METARSLITQNVFENLEFYTDMVYKNGENSEYLGIRLLEEKEKFVKGAYIHSTARLYLHYRETGDSREASAWEKLIHGIRLLENDTLRSWGELNALRGVMCLHKAGMLNKLPEDCIAILRDRTDIDDFYDRSIGQLKGAASNYYQVAMACAGYREAVGWGIDGECDKIKEKLLGIMREASDGGWMDEQPPYGRFDRYSIIISSELIDTLSSIEKELPEFAINNLRNAAELVLACHNDRGDGVQYGRSLSVHGDCAYLEILATALRVGIIEEEKKPLALSFCGAILRKSFDFWFDRARNSYNIWLDGRTTNNYRQIHRLLDVNLDMALHMLTTLDNLIEAGCADLPVDAPLPKNPHDFGSPYKTVFTLGSNRPRIMYSFVHNDRLIQLPLIGTGNLALKASYQPFPASAELLEASPEVNLPFLVPNFTDESGRLLIPSGFYTEITDRQITENGELGTEIIARGNMSAFADLKSGVKESDITFTAVYTFIGDKITLEYEAHTDIPLNCRVLYAYGRNGCEVSFNGNITEEISVAGDKNYFTPHGPCDKKREYNAQTNKVKIELEL